MKTDYVLITPAYNEEAHIGRLIECVRAQIIRPQCWVIVNDGSTDRTGEIIDSFAAQESFIQPLHLKRENVSTYYSHKTEVFERGYQSLPSGIMYDFIGSLDADISFGPDYYQNLLREMDRNPRLGLTSGQYLYQMGERIEAVLIDKSCVPGSLQFFRRECYEQIRGYVSLKYGGDDSLATTMARMYGWDAYSFPQYQVFQHRVVGTVGHSILKARFRQGLTEYGLGSHPLFMLCKSVRRAVLEKPYFLGSAARLCGFLCGYLRREERQIPADVVRYVRKEQMQRLWKIGGKEPLAVRKGAEQE